MSEMCKGCFDARFLSCFLTAAAVSLAGASAMAQNPDWPGDPESDPLMTLPDDGGYIQFEGEDIRDGQWNLWSFTPDRWADNPGFRTEEIALGTGIWADQAWQYTPGDSRVLIAVLDSGVYWESDDLINKYYINAGELPDDAMRPMVPDDYDGDPFDVNGDGTFNAADYAHFFPDEELARIDGAGNNNGFIDPQDLILMHSDGVDDDGNGYIDDISGWDFHWNDNDPLDNTRFGHGNGEARDSGAEGNNGRGGIGVCPRCTLIMVRVGDSFVPDVNDFGDGVVFAVDSGADVIQEALGSVNNTPHAIASIEYAYANNVAVIASAADELSFHHNMPGTTNHTIYVHAIVHDAARDEATTFLNFNNCTNYGGQLVLSTPGGGCSSEAVGITSGHAGLLYSAALAVDLDPPLSAEEVRGLMIMSVDDIDVPESRDTETVGQLCTLANEDEVCGDSDLFRCAVPPNSVTGEGQCFNTKFPSDEGWDLHFGYGRNNAYRSVKMIFDDEIPPEVDIEGPLWFETIDPMRGEPISITGRIGDRIDGLDARYAEYEYTIEWALGVDPKGGWTEISSGTTAGMTGELTTWDMSDLPDDFDFSNPPSDPHEDAVTLRIRVTANAGALASEFRKTIFLHHDESLLDGFPLYVGSSFESSPKFFDLDGNGADEIVVASSDGMIHAFTADGSELDGFPVAMGLRPGHDDNLPNSHRNSCAYRTDKTGCAVQNLTLDPDVRQSLIGTVAIGDIDADDDPEIVASSIDGQVFAFHHDGSDVDGFPVGTDYALSEAARNPDSDVARRNTLDQGFFGSPVLYDLDGDGDLEIINAAMDQHVYVWDHDGSTHEGFPVLCRDVEDGNRGFRIVQTPAVGDIDLDGSPEIITGTNEYYNENETRTYIIHADGNNHDGGPFELGGPILNFGLIGEVLPVVGEGTVSNPVIADVDFDGHPEFAMESIAGQPIFHRLDPDEDDEELIEVNRVNNVVFGPGSNSLDTPAYPLINNGSFGRVDPSGDLAYVKGTAGFNFASSFAEGGTRLVFDHHISAWNTNPAKNPGDGGPFIEGFPQIVDDWQFFMNPALFDIDSDGLSEVVLGTGGYLLRAFNYRGEQPAGWPKSTGGWIISSPAVGDVDGDGMFEVATGTRNGWFFVWNTDAPTTNRLDWQSFGHDPANTNNYATPLPSYGDALCGNGVREGDEACDGTDLGGATCADQDGFDGGELVCSDCALDTSGCTMMSGNNGNNGNNGTNNGDPDTGTPDAGTGDDTGNGGGGGGGGDDGCCTVAPSAPASIPMLPATLALLAIVGLVVRRLR